MAPPSAVALAAADVIRRPGVRAFGLDHARLLAPLGTIPDPAERRLIIDDLRDELVLPLGSVVMPAGLRTGRPAGKLTLRSVTGETLLDLVPGNLDLIDLPAGEVAIADLRFRDAVDLGPRVRHAAVEVTGGMAGLLVDLRDVPLRLPERLEMRREAMAAWEVHVLGGERRVTAVDRWRAEIPVRPMLENSLEARFVLMPGDRALVVTGDVVKPGDPLLEHLRDRRIDEVAIAAGTDDQARHTAGEQWSQAAGGRLRRDEAADGELLSIVPGQRDRWRIVVGDQRDAIDTSVGGEVIAVRPGGEVRIRVAGRALPGAFAAGVPAHGQLELATDPFGDLRPGGIDVGRAGSILVVGSRIDAEALTRARAMGVRGIVVASLPGKDLRDFQRLRAPPARRAPSVAAVRGPRPRRRRPARDRRPRSPPCSSGIAGARWRSSSTRPRWCSRRPSYEVPVIDDDWVRVRGGPSAGARGTASSGWPACGDSPAASSWSRRGWRSTADAPVAIPIGDLERLA